MKCKIILKVQLPSKFFMMNLMSKSLQLKVVNSGKDFRNLELRPDKGGVFENFIVSEIEKKRKNTQNYFKEITRL